MSDIYNPPSDGAALVLQWLRRCRESQFAHYFVAAKYEKQTGQFGIPVIIINSIVSASLFATFLKSENELIRFFALALSLLSIVLSSLQTYLKLSDKAEMHRLAGAEYAELRRKLEVIHASGLVDANKLDGIEKQISSLAKKAPNIPASVFNKAKPSA